MRYRERVVVVTGAAGGIGRALCMQLGREGAHLGLIDIDAVALERLQNDLTAAGFCCAAAHADVGSREQARAAVRSLEAKLGTADILIAAAGICRLSPIDDLRTDQLDEMMRVNFFGTAFVVEAVLPQMIERRNGHIVGVASLAASCPLPFESAYCASKAAVATYLQSLRAPLRRRGIKVTVAYLGFVKTALLDNLLAETGAPPPPGTVGAEKVAVKLSDGIRRGARVIRFPASTAWLARIAGWLPAALYDWVMIRIAARLRLPH